ncbi:MAG TPA: hypothetical protein VKX96_14070 [Chloroflexota bacterium]|jgi:hypothetical protein|nr:hypothetical protein [Chloroflexota bacterium]
MANKNRPARMQKKPKKDAKLKTVSTEEAVPMTVEVIKRKRKERLPEDE